MQNLKELVRGYKSHSEWFYGIQCQLVHGENDFA